MSNFYNEYQESLLKTDENELTGVKDIFDQEAHSRPQGKVNHPKRVSKYFSLLFSTNVLMKIRHRK